MSVNNVDLSKIGLSWGYEGEFEPSNWHAVSPHASGSHQSPIDINTNEAIFNQKLVENALSFNYSNECFTSVLNTGSSFKISGSQDATSNVHGGPVSQNHKFLQFHMHWGNDENVGSEHLVDGKSYAGEIHFVNWNSEKYSEASEAVQSDKHDGLIVLGILVQVGNHNDEFQKLVDCLEEITLRDQKTDIKHALDVAQLFPADTSSYWTYEGSLTTPPCTECVQWVVFRDPIEISLEQLNKLRNLYQCKESEHCCDVYRINQNFRPVCQLNERKVYRSFN